MPAKDIYHDVVKQALIKDGWTITDDPLRLRWAKRNIYIDLGQNGLSVRNEVNTESPSRSKVLLVLLKLLILNRL